MAIAYIFFSLISLITAGFRPIISSVSTNESVFGTCVAKHATPLRINSPTDTTETVQWVTLAQADAHCADPNNTKKVYVFFTADWCAFCHLMEREAFVNKELVAYLNANFWCVKFNTEWQDTVAFGGKRFGLVTHRGWQCNGFAATYLDDKLAFPSHLVLDAHGQKMAALAGYQNYFQMMTLVTYFNENHYLTTDLATYGNTYQMPSWGGKGSRSGTVRRWKN